MKNYHDEYVQTAIIILIISFFDIVGLLYLFYWALGGKVEKK